QVAGDERLRAGGAAIGVAQVNDRCDVERADVRVDAVVAAQVDPLDRDARGGEQRGREGPGPAHPREREDAAVVVGIAVGCEQADVARAGARQRAPERVDRLLVAPLGEVGDREQHAPAARGGGHSTQRPASSTRVPPTSSVGSTTTTSRWTGTETVPPMPALAPNATWTVPRIFSSSSTSPVRIAASFVPTPSSATFVPRRPCAWRRWRNSGPSGPFAAVRWPSATVSRTGSGEIPSDASDVAASVPLADSGAMKPSPAGRFPNALPAAISP